MPKLGDIVLLSFPYSDQAGGKVRPGLVIGSNRRSKSDDVNVAYITTEVDAYAADAAAVLITAGDLAEGALKRDSLVRVDKAITVQRRICRKVASVNSKKLDEVLRAATAFNVENFAEHKYKSSDFEPGFSVIPPSGKVLGAGELINMVDASLDGWLTTGRFNKAFEQRFAEFVGVPYALTTTSGSAANLLAFTALTSDKLGERALQPGDEVITVAAGFPTTVNPILQNGMVPVFVDVDIPTYNIDAEKIEAALTDRTRAIMIAHTLGNPYNLDAVMAVAERHKLWVIEDCCDALGSLYQGRHVGTFGHIATCSFYPAHHITMGEGGIVFTKDRKLKKIVESFRDWGRDCYCAPGCDDTCRRRFGWQLGDLPKGYDHKYTYSHLGYNLNISDMQAACALAQMDRLPDFIVARKRNFDYLKTRLQSCADKLVLPEATAGSEPSWFGFPITIKASAGIERVELLKHLDRHKIGTRLLFAGNLTRQPYFKGRNYRISGDLTRTDDIMNNTFWIGVYPGLSEQMLDYAAGQIEAFLGVKS
ncbi:lipopolysaccharide biosynthesis protein RfbH [Candidatus Methylobacter oryzae]|uniref:Lipopolysaccharide biosynthesis protein RfbH n=1 Tax=Candidatus Methylobacter oryzae TaxID=2497749 RepID=A0ABY3C7V7_9GAMM|nr:lipopolysaccharide biosynthesis protein RfbH [Candidatus Methylobacter oryzae]TRW92188.1 lipopolysaccharide biosynthesis protein RfbH [Candidatus Methylobacter oryzae]